jgi:hypothetical protein
LEPNSYVEQAPWYSDKEYASKAAAGYNSGL